MVCDRNVRHAHASIRLRTPRNRPSQERPAGRRAAGARIRESAPFRPGANTHEALDACAVRRTQSRPRGPASSATLTLRFGCVRSGTVLLKAAGPGHGDTASGTKRARHDACDPPRAIQMVREKWRPRPLPSQGRGDTMVVHPFVRRSSALIRGGPVRRHRAKLSLERLGTPVAQLWDCVPLSCARAAETTLFAGSIPSRGPLQSWIPPGRAACPAGAQRRFRCSFAPRVQHPSNRAFQWGHSAARPATVSSLNTISMPAGAGDASGPACGNC